MGRALVFSGRLVAILEFLYVGVSWLRPIRSGHAKADYIVTAVIMAVYCAATAVMLAIPKPAPRRRGTWAECAFVCGCMILPMAFMIPHWLGWRTQPLSSAGIWLIASGALGALAATLPMGRSFGLLPARRTLVRRGAHALVRHPIYTCHAVILIGYLLIAFSPWMAAVAAASWVGLVVTAAFEERVLRGDGEYEAYCRKVRWAFVPYIA